MELRTWLIVSAESAESFILCRSVARGAKEQAMHARFAARIEAGSSFYVTRNVAFFGNFVGEYSSQSSSNAGNGGLKVTW